MLYKTGNPELKNTVGVPLTCTHGFLTIGIRFPLRVDGADTSTDLSLCFTPDGPDGMMLRSIVNSGDCQNFDIGVSFTGRFFNRSLVLQVQPRMWFSKLTGIYSDTYNYLMVSASATYYLEIILCLVVFLPLPTGD